MNYSTTFEWVGVVWWLAVPLMIAVWFAMGYWQRQEIVEVPTRAQIIMRWLRRGVVVVLTVALMEPVLTRTATYSELPAVAVVVDASGSMGLDDRDMHPSLRLDEAESLGLLSAQLRPESGKQVADKLQELVQYLPTMSRSLTGLAQPTQYQAMDRASADYIHLLQSAQYSLFIEAVSDVDAVVQILHDVIRVREAPLSSGIDYRALAESLVSIIPTCESLRDRAYAAQRAADTALVAGAESGSPVARALGTLSRMSRLERAQAFVNQRLIPALGQHVRVEVFAAGTAGSGSDITMTPITSGMQLPAPSGATDVAGPFTWLSRNWTARHLGGIIYLGDGRQTTGADPVPVIRALAARGGHVHTVLIGDPDVPHDAALAGISGPAEVFRGENIPLDVRWRVSGFADRPWDIIIVSGDVEIDRRTVRGDGTWQVARFEVAADHVPDAKNAPVIFRARIEPSRKRQQDSPIRPGGGLLRDVWLGVGGNRLADFFLSGIASRRSDERGEVALAQIADKRENYASRLRGWIVPPETGNYTFWIAGDDEAELWLGVSGTPYDRVRIAYSPEWTHLNEWDRFTSQQSKAIALVAGQPCYIEVLHKQGTGEGHVEIGWQTPSNRLERPISGSWLAPWRDGLATEVGDEIQFPEASVLNNAAEAAVMVNEDPLRILVVDHYPRWDMRYVTGFFERDRRIEVVRRYRSILLARGERNLIPESQADVDNFDVIVIGDLAPGELNADDQHHLSDFVSRRGGFVVAMAGPRGMPWGYSLGYLADMLPVRAAAVPDDARALRVTLTAEGIEHPVTRVLDDAGLNARLWSELSVIHWAATAVTAKPSAQVLVASNDASQAPLVVLGRHGAGRVAWVGTDESWRWRDRLGDRVQQSFWLQIMRWGLGSRLRGQDRRLQIALDRSLIEPGEGVDIRARVVHDAKVSPPKGRIEELNEHGIVVGQRLGVCSLVPDTDVWSYRVADLTVGRWRITVTATATAESTVTAEDELTEVRELLVRQRPSSEGVDLGADPAGLARMADAGGGMSVTAAHCEQVANEIIRNSKPKASERRSTTILWQSYATLLLVTGLLCAEWMWRKRWGLA